MGAYPLYLAIALFFAVSGFLEPKSWAGRSFKICAALHQRWEAAPQLQVASVEVYESRYRQLKTLVDSHGDGPVRILMGGSPRLGKSTLLRRLHDDWNQSAEQIAILIDLTQRMIDVNPRILTMREVAEEFFSATVASVKDRLPAAARDRFRNWPEDPSILRLVAGNDFGGLVGLVSEDLAKFGVSPPLVIIDEFGLIPEKDVLASLLRSPRSRVVLNQAKYFPTDDEMLRELAQSSQILGKYSRSETPFATFPVLRETPDTIRKFLNRARPGPKVDFTDDAQTQLLQASDGLFPRVVAILSRLTNGRPWPAAVDRDRIAYAVAQLRAHPGLSEGRPGEFRAMMNSVSLEIADPDGQIDWAYRIRPDSAWPIPAAKRPETISGDLTLVVTGNESDLFSAVPQVLAGPGPNPAHGRWIRINSSSTLEEIADDLQSPPSTVSDSFTGESDIFAWLRRFNEGRDDPVGIYARADETSAAATEFLRVIMAQKPGLRRIVFFKKATYDQTRSRLAPLMTGPHVKVVKKINLTESEFVTALQSLARRAEGALTSEAGHLLYRASRGDWQTAIDLIRMLPPRSKTIEKADVENLLKNIDEKI